MNTAEVDIDRLVDYKSEYTQYIKKAKITGDQLIGLCRSMMTEITAFQ